MVAQAVLWFILGYALYTSVNIDDHRKPKPGSSRHKLTPAFGELRRLSG
jgi:hypothetical protein